MPDEEPGLLGSLPRSRPGTRSDKRDSGAEPSGAEPESRSPASRPAAKRSQAAKPGSKRSTTARKAKPVAVSVTEPRDEGQEPGAGKPGPLRSAARVAGTGLRVAEGVTREVLRRLPRP